jgi:hypothetical protein
MDVYPLVTTSPNSTPADVAGDLGRDDTTILYGGGELNGGSVNGLRLRGGWWFRQGRWAIESEFFGFKSSSQSFSASSDGSTILARPYFNIITGNQAAQLIAYPGLVSGGISINSKSRLESGLINFRRSFLPIEVLGCNDGCDPPDRVDWIAGYRVLKLKDELTIDENRNALISIDPDSRLSSDAFSTENLFQGLQLGVVYQAYFRRLTMESMLRVALGNNRQRVSIRGATTISDFGVTNDYIGGLLAQRTNIGDSESNQFTMIPELGLNFKLRITRCLHGMIGYNVIYFPNVLRASEQIDSDVNIGLVPPEDANLVGALRPRFTPVENDYWAHGFNFGAELKF